MDIRRKNIDGRDYSIFIPSALQAMPICTRTSVLLGPLLGSLGKNILEGGLATFSNVISQVDPEKLDKLLMDVVYLGKLTCNQIPLCDDLSFNKHFDNHRSDLFVVCVWALWEVVKDFFPGLGTFFQKFFNVVTNQESQSPLTGK